MQEKNIIGPGSRTRTQVSSVRSLLLSALLGLACPAWAQESCRGSAAGLAGNSTLNIRIDNDMFGGVEQDQGYSNGFLISSVSPNLVDYINDPCLPRPVRRLNRYLSWLQPEGFDEQNMTIGLGQMLYTPTDRERTDLITNDRPYAGALMLSWGYNARRGDHLRTSQVRVGIVGPSALGRQVQNWWHGIIGTDRFHGWDRQLRDEPVLQLIHERRTRQFSRTFSNGWGQDAISHWGVSLGNFATYANAGFEWRLGLRLPDNFGTAPLRPAGENTSPGRILPGQTWNAHLFIATDARWVVRDITLDGNTFRSSHRIDKEPFVADITYGAALSRGSWRFAFARYHRTREFGGQRERPVYGTVTISKRF